MLHAVSDPGQFTLLYGITLEADSATIDTGAAGFSTAFSDLLLLMSLRTADAVVGSSVTMQFNGDTGLNYDDQKMRVINVTVSGAIGLAGSSISIETLGASAQAGAFSTVAYWIPAYTSAVSHKCLAGNSNRIEDTAADCRTTFQSGRWRSTSALNRIVLTGSGNIVTGSRLAVYAR